MKSNLSLVFLCLLSVTLAAQNKSVYKIDDYTYSLKVKTSQSRILYNYGLNLSFSVYKNDKFIHPADPSDGRYIGCRYPWNGAGSNYTIEQLKGFGGKKIGWIINGMYEACGTSYSRQKQIFILPFEDTYYSFCINYQGQYFDVVIEDVAENVLSIWYNEYVMAGRGMPDNYLVPRKIDLVKSTYGLEIKKGDLMVGIENLEKVVPNNERFFVSLFNAAITQTNPDLLKYAINSYYNEKDKEVYEIYKIPISLEEMDKLFVNLTEIKFKEEQHKIMMDKFRLKTDKLPNLFSFK